MRIVLINPGNDLGKMFGRYAAAMQPVVPSGLAYIAAFVRAGGHEARIIDQYGTKESHTALAQRVAKLEPDVVGISVLTPAAPSAEELSSELRKALPRVKIVWGNIHARVFADDILSAGIADAVVHQEGEATFLDYVNHLEGEMSPAEVAGLSYRNGEGQVFHNPARALLEDLDALPYPAYDLLDLKRYVAPPMLSLMEPILPIQASRGCPFTCHYCSQENFPRGFRARSIESVVDEMEFHHNRYGIRYMGFLDANFPYNRSSAMEFAEAFMDRGLHKKITWLTETRVDLIDDECMAALARAGMRLIMFGFESGTQEMLDSYNKRVRLEAAHAAMAAARKHKVAVLGLFMLGMPGETVASAEATIRLAINLDPDFAKFNMAVPYPGSEFFESWRETFPGPIDFAKFSSWLDKTSEGGLLFTPEGMPGRTLLELRDRAMREFYLRPWFILRHIRKGTLGPRGAARGVSVFLSSWSRYEAKQLLQKPLRTLLAAGKL